MVEQQLGGGRLHRVVEVAGQDHRWLVTVPGQRFGDSDAEGGGPAGAAVEGIGAVAGAFVFVVGVEPAAGEGQQLRFRWQVISRIGMPASLVTVMASAPRPSCARVAPVSST